MEKSFIESHTAWKYISDLSGTQRYHVLFGNQGAEIANFFKVKIEEWPFTSLSKVPDDCVCISVTDPYRNISFIAVLNPKES